MTQQKTSNPLRCVCRHKPLLGFYGIDEKGRGYFHVKIRKGGELRGEVVFHFGLVRIHCRECLRWTALNLKSQDYKTGVGKPSVVEGGDG